jgi:hypothetical protein
MCLTGSSIAVYQLKDGSPRYGVRTAHQDSEQLQPAIQRGNPEAIAREAGQLGLHHLAAAADHRLTRKWADGDDELLVRLREAHPAELQEAEQIVNAKLGNPKRWLLKARSNYTRGLAPVIARRQEAGMLSRAMFLRLFLIVLLIVPSVLAVSFSVPLLYLVFIGIASILLALYLGGVVTEWLRLPVQPGIRSGWLKELRQDIVDATLLAVLEKKRALVDSQTSAAARRGWKHIRFVAAQVDRIDQGPGA